MWPQIRGQAEYIVVIRRSVTLIHFRLQPRI
jgi:hypothetical protein